MGAEPPDVVIVDSDGAAEQLPPDRPPRGSASSARRWSALLIGALLVFALGFAVGRNSGYGTGHDAALGRSPVGSENPSGTTESAVPGADTSPHRTDTGRGATYGGTASTATT